MSGITSDHNGFLVCDGRAISRTTYSALFAIIGTNFGAGNGSTTFNLPDPRGRAIAASGSGAGLTARILGTSLGAENHTLTISEMPNHNHTVQGYVRTDYDANDAFSNFSGLDTGGSNYASTFVGGGQPHNNMQPTLFIGNLFIYAGV
jgi:microcystin-dependent protein